MSGHNSNDVFILRKYHVFWLIMSTVAALVLTKIKVVLMPFLFALIIATLFHDLVTFFEKRSIPRSLSSFLIVIFIFSLIFYIIYISIPSFYKILIQLIGFIEKNGKNAVIIHRDNLNKVFDLLDTTLIDFLHDTFHQYSRDLLIIFSNLLRETVSSSMHIITIIGFFCISPIITFLFLKDFPSFTQACYSIVPKRYLTDFKQLTNDINDNVFKYIEGQFIVSIFLTCFYSVLLLGIGVKGWFLIGVLVGFTSYVPYIGFYTSSIVALIMVYDQYHSVKYMIITFAVLVLGQWIEGNFITPKIIGDRIGLHPNWVILGMLACVPIFGIIGIMFAVPLTGICGVIIKHFFKKYKASEFYKC